MMAIVFILWLLVTMYVLYKRYVPVFGLNCSELEKVRQKDDILLLDVRDFPVAHKLTVGGTINIPLAYLKRHYDQIEGETVFLIGSEKFEINMTTRFLKRKGIKVAGFTIKNDLNRHDCKEKREPYGV
ncbi:hypothetical protein AB3N04_08255 [Alkalihalophilus sp. As8PL]|uniref:Rhodanese domain-containing protein n=1 Tax=Alkalihalophilus sp. As8PL TaxID=3237103 RepID=A0AB39BWP0_9BACI